MGANINKSFESVGNFFTGGDQIPWCERDIVARCEIEVAEAQIGSSYELFKECLMRLSWSLVHSRHPQDVLRGITMLEASVCDYGSNIMHVKETLYLLAVGHYRNGDYSKNRELVEQCLTTAPAWRQALILRKMNEDKIKRDGTIGIGIVATAVGLIASGIAAALARKK